MEARQNVILIKDHSSFKFKNQYKKWNIITNVLLLPEKPFGRQKPKKGGMFKEGTPHQFMFKRTGIKEQENYVRQYPHSTVWSNITGKVTVSERFLFGREL